jgi:hypothetical protein
MFLEIICRICDRKQFCSIKFIMDLEVNYTGFFLFSILYFILAEMSPKLGSMFKLLNIPQRKNKLRKTS